MTDWTVLQPPPEPPITPAPTTIRGCFALAWRILKVRLRIGGGEAPRQIMPWEQ